MLEVLSREGELMLKDKQIEAEMIEVIAQRMAQLNGLRWSWEAIDNLARLAQKLGVRTEVIERRNEILEEGNN